MLTEFIERLLSARGIEDIRRIYLEAVGHYGFEHAFYAARFMLALPASLTRDSTIVITNMTEPGLGEAVGGRSQYRDLWSEWVRCNDGEISSRELLQQAGDRVQSATLLAAQQFGLEAMQILSLRDKVLRSLGGVILCPFAGARHDEVTRRWQKAAREIRSLSWVMHMRVATMRRTEPQTILTQRQREVLEWRSCGKTISEIGTILGVTPATIEKHMRLAREALGVETTSQAILKAHVSHELFMQDEAADPFW